MRVVRGAAEKGCERTNCKTVKYPPLRQHRRLDSGAANSTGTDQQ